MQVEFGRYTDAFKSSHQLERWKESDRLYAEGHYLPSYLAFFDYLRDPAVENVQFEERDGRIYFQLYQGSKSISGYADGQRIEAESEVAQMEKPSVAVMRKLLEVNFALSYSRFALKENTICIRFDTTVEGGQPAKLYHALREIALNADYYDDPLVQEFSALRPIDNSKVRKLQENELEVKREFFSRWINEALQQIGELHPDKQSGAISWVLLGAIYRIDYLIAPQGELMNDLRKITTIYYAQDGKSYPEKNYQMKLALEKLVAEGIERTSRELYSVTSTFATTQNAGADMVVNTLNDVFNGYNVWKNPDKPTAALACLEYGATFSLFSYSLPKPVSDLLLFFLQIYHPEYFSALGYQESYYNPQGQEFAQDLIRERMGEIVERSREAFPGLTFRTEMVNFNSMMEFAQSYMSEMHAMASAFAK